MDRFSDEGTLMMDRQYWHVPGARSWHAESETNRIHSLCGLLLVDRKGTRLGLNQSDRLPPTAHLCGNCSRIIAARTDIEPTKRAADYSSDYSYVSDVPEPVASEQDDYRGAAPV